MIEPYYSDALCTIYQGDCRTILPELIEPVDLCFTDPPYGETSLAWDRRVEGWPALVLNHLRYGASLWVFGSLRAFLETAGDFTAYRLAQDVIWKKHNGSNFHADRFRRIHEIVAHFYPTSTSWTDVYKVPQTTPDAVARVVRKKGRPAHTGHIDATPYMSVDGGPRLMRSVLEVRSCHGYAEHETQKPLGILAPLLEYSCPAGGIVLDPFAGVGPVGVAAKQTGRRSVLIELREECCEIAARTLEQVLPLVSIEVVMEEQNIMQFEVQS